MAGKKHNWISYGRRGIIVKTQVYDENERLLDKFRWVASDRKSEQKIFTLLKKKYNIFLKPTIEEKDSINFSK